MADINSESKSITPVERFEQNCEAADTLDQNRIFTLIELLYFAYRDFTSDCDDILEAINFGRAHHRVIHFVNRYPGLRVADLLEILKITKQSLARVLKQLIDEDYIYQQAGKKDRRERHLFVTEKGNTLATKLAAPQIEHMRRAITSIECDDSELIEDFLYSLIQQSSRHDVITLIAENTPSLLKSLGPSKKSTTQQDQNNHE